MRFGDGMWGSRGEESRIIQVPEARLRWARDSAAGGQKGHHRRNRAWREEDDLSVWHVGFKST